MRPIIVLLFVIAALAAGGAAYAFEPCERAAVVEATIEARAAQPDMPCCEAQAVVHCAGSATMFGAPHSASTALTAPCSEPVSVAQLHLSALTNRAPPSPPPILH